MAKKKIDSSDIFGELAAEFKGQVASEKSDSKYFIDTGNLALNFASSGKFMGGGIPGGKITELFGPESSGKSLWASNIIRGTQAINGIPVLLDAEDAFNPEFAVVANHIDLNKLLYFRPSEIDCLEAVFAKIYNLIRAVRDKDKNRPLVFVYDSIAVSPSARELRETDLSENPTQAEWKSVVGAKEQPGERARICSKELRKLETLLEKNNATLVVLNQTRMKIGIMYGSPETVAGGGESLKFYTSCRFRTSTQKTIENKKLEKTIGVNLKIKNRKNRSFRPFVEVEGIQLFFEHGVNPLSGLLSCLIQCERIELVKTGLYRVKEPWANGQEIEFEATKGINLVPKEPVLKCPALIDATSEAEVANYLSLFDSAINLTLSDDVEEKEVGTLDVE